MTNRTWPPVIGLRTLILLLVVACRKEPGDGGASQLGEVHYVTADELAALEQSGDVFELGEVDRAAEEERRAQAEAEATSIIEAYVADHPDLADELLWEVTSGAATEQPDGNFLVEIGATGRSVILHGPGWERRSDAAAIELLDDPDANRGVLETLHPIVPEYCRPLVPSEGLWGQLSVEELQESSASLAACWDEWRSFSRPFDDDNVPPQNDEVNPPTDTGTCDMPFPILTAGGNDGYTFCGPTNPMVTGFAFYGQLSAIKDQANRGTCVAFGSAAALEYAARRIDGVNIDITEQSLYSLGKYDLYGEHFGDGLPTSDFLATLPSLGWNIDLESSWGYNPSWCRQTFDESNFYLDSCVNYENDACSESAHQLGLYSAGPGEPVYLYRPVNLGDGQYVVLEETNTLFLLDLLVAGELIVNAAVTAGWGAVASLTLDEDFMNAASTGFLPDDNDDEVGGHAVQVVRIVESNSAPGGAWVVIKNSWGCGWGDGGFGYLSMEWFLGHVKAVSLVRPQVVVFNTPPSVTITSPGSTTEPVAGFGNDFTLTASVTDAEEGDGCCDVTWSSTIDGTLGTGNPLDVTLLGNGTRVITAVVRDEYGKLAEDTVTITLTNQAPEPEILRPEWQPTAPRALLGQRVPLGAGVPFSGVAPDPNKLFEVPCDRQSWTVSGDFDIEVISGCTANVQPDALGWYQVKYAASDALGATGYDYRWIRVVEWGPNDLPYVAISNPPKDDYFADPDQTITLTAEVASGTGAPPDVRWVLIDGGETELGTGATLPWTPSDDVPFNCGGAAVELRAEATDANGTSTDQIAVFVSYPPC